MRRYLILISFILSALPGCSSLSVNYDYDQRIDFSRYKTYDWLPSPKGAKIDSFNHRRFVTAVENNLADKGLARDISKPDILIATHFGKEKKVEISNRGYVYAPSRYYTGYGYRYPSRHGYSTEYVVSGGIDVYEYEQGTLIVDFIDARTKQLIWRATARAIISPASTPEKQTEKINNAVNEILSSFPPAKAGAGQKASTPASRY